MKKFLLLMLAIVLPAITFADNYKVTYSAGEGGTLTVNYSDGGWKAVENGAEYAEGTWLQVRPNANSGYKFKSLTMNGEEVELSGKYFNTQVTSDLDFVATFEKDGTSEACNVSISVEGNGAVTSAKTYFSGETFDPAASTLQVNKDEILLFTLVPDAGYCVESLLFNGTDYAMRVDHSTTECTWQTPYIEGDVEISIVFGEVGAGINDITSNLSPLTSQLYDMKGQRVGSTHHGVFIQNGKKVVK